MPPRPQVAPARPSRRVLDLLRTATRPDMVEDVIDYLASRKLWPLPRGCDLRAHVGAEYWEAGNPPTQIGRYPALVGRVLDIAGDLVTAHVTYLKDGRKVQGLTPRKLLSGTGGRIGCAVRLTALKGPCLVICEGIETGLAAHKILDSSVWACLNTSLLGKFKPPPEVERLVVAVDNDDAGRRAADQLRGRIRDIPVDMVFPRAGDFADDWESQ